MVGSGIPVLGLLLLMQGSVGKGATVDVGGHLGFQTVPNTTSFLPQMGMESRDSSTHGVSGS
jgi:hypothetical protein